MVRCFFDIKAIEYGSKNMSVLPSKGEYAGGEYENVHKYADLNDAEHQKSLKH